MEDRLENDNTEADWKEGTLDLCRLRGYSSLDEADRSWHFLQYIELIFSHVCIFYLLSSSGQKPWHSRLYSTIQLLEHSRPTVMFFFEG